MQARPAPRPFRSVPVQRHINVSRPPLEKTNAGDGLLHRVISAVKPAEFSKAETPLRLIPIGGVEEVGKKMTVLEYGNDII
ncbi:hypothetical protein D4R52_03405, partial [bacterium]